MHFSTHIFTMKYLWHLTCISPFKMLRDVSLFFVSSSTMLTGHWADEPISMHIAFGWQLKSLVCNKCKFMGFVLKVQGVDSARHLWSHFHFAYNWIRQKLCYFALISNLTIYYSSCLFRNRFYTALKSKGLFHRVTCTHVHYGRSITFGCIRNQFWTCLTVWWWAGI